MTGPIAPSDTALAPLIARETERFAREHPASIAHASCARESLLGGVPMSWMLRWASPVPLVLREARGATVTDIDGRTYADLCLGDTGAMTGHGPAPIVEAITDRYTRGATAMLPTEDAAWVGTELTRRFGVDRWQFTVSATDANRFALRMARAITGRPKVLVFSYCYHGTVDEAFITLEDGQPAVREGNVGPAFDVRETTRVVEFNDLDGLERELRHEDVAVVLTEPALTNIGIVLPEPGFHDELRRLCTETGTLLLIDETHTLSAGPGGCTQAWGLDPDLVVMGKAIAGGVPTGAFGMRAELAARMLADRDADIEDVGGVGGTLAGNALSMAAARAALSEVLTDDAYMHTIALAGRFADGVRDVLAHHGVPWHVTQLGARAEYRFSAEPPRDGGTSEAIGHEGLERFLHLHALNRGVLITPFHNMALMCPATTEAHVDRHTAAFDEAVGEIAQLV
ncbi:MAG: transaminase [Solirubrobacteraceae bacterium]